MNKTEYVECLGYKVYRDGTIFNKYGNELTQHHITKQIKILINGKRKNVSVSKFVYYAFNRDYDYTDKNSFISFKDSDDNNLAINNLELGYKGNYLQGENNSCSKITDKQVIEIIQKYKQGHKKYTYEQLAKEYDISVTLVCQIINKKARNKKNYKMKVGKQK